MAETLPAYMPLARQLLREFESASGKLRDDGLQSCIDSQIAASVTALDAYVAYFYEQNVKELDGLVFDNHLETITTLLRAEFEMETLRTLMATVRPLLKLDNEQNQEIRLETLEYYRGVTDKVEVHDAIAAQHQRDHANFETKFATFLKNNRWYQYFKSAAFVVVHPEEPLPEDEADDDIGIDGGKISLRDPLLMELYTEPMVSRKCGHIYDKRHVNVLFDATGRAECPVSGCDSQVDRHDLEPDPLMKLRVRVHQLSEAHKKHTRPSHASVDAAS